MWRPTKSPQKTGETFDAVVDRALPLSRSPFPALQRRLVNLGQKLTQPKG